MILFPDIPLPQFNIVRIQGITGPEESWHGWIYVQFEGTLINIQEFRDWLQKHNLTSPNGYVYFRWAVTDAIPGTVGENSGYIGASLTDGTIQPAVEAEYHGKFAPAQTGKWNRLNFIQFFCFRSMEDWSDYDPPVFFCNVNVPLAKDVNWVGKPWTDFQFNQAPTPPPTCPSGQHWDPDLNACVPDTIPPTVYTLTLTQTSGGSITSPETSYNSGDTATINASASSGYLFDHWLVDGSRPTAPYDTTNPLSLIMNSNHTVQAAFRARVRSKCEVRYGDWSIFNPLRDWICKLQGVETS